jgi:phosphoribosylanthranilate isomerase
VSSPPWNDPSPGRVRIKICGLQTPADIEAAIESGADAIGLVLAEGSPRSVDERTLRTLAAAAGERIAAISLMVDPSESQVRRRPTDWIQLHGDEAPPLVHAAAEGGPVIRAVPFDDLAAITHWDDDPSVARLLIDSSRGGSGVAFDHAAFVDTAAALRTPWILAGGLTPDTVTAAIECLRPWAVDVSSGVESARGIKDPDRIAAFCQAARGASS